MIESARARAAFFQRKPISSWITSYFTKAPVDLQERVDSETALDVDHTIPVGQLPDPFHPA